MARTDLEEGGCPPCYPASLGFPLQNIPEEYEGIVSYFKSLPPVGLPVLPAQLSDWRSYPTGGAFATTRRESDATIYSGKASLSTWKRCATEDIKGEREKLRAARARKQLEDAELRERDVKLFGYGEEAKCQLRRHRSLLRWIEEQRVAFATDQALSIDTSITQDDDGSQAKEDKPSAISRSPAPARRKRGKNACSVLSPIRSAISKNQPWKRSKLRPSKRDVPQSAEKATSESNTPRCSQRIRDLRGNKPQHGKKSTPLRPFWPQRVSKPVRKSPTSKPCANAKGNSKSRPINNIYLS